jgi:hypothetical protein
MDTPAKEPLDHAAPRPDGFSFSPLLPATDRGARNLVVLIAALLFAACLSATFSVSTKLADCRQQAPLEEGGISAAVLPAETDAALPPRAL